MEDSYMTTPVYIRTTIALFKKKLGVGFYKNLNSALRAIGHVQDFTQEEREEAKAAATLHFGTMQNPLKELLSAYEKINDNGYYWQQIADTIGVHIHTIQNLRAGKNLSATSVQALQEGLKKYEETPEKPKAKKRKASPAPQAKPSIVEHAHTPTGIPTLIELQIRELELNRALQQYHVGAPKHLNGARAR
jgi:hypothetical protein